MFTVLRFYNKVNCIIDNKISISLQICFHIIYIYSLVYTYITYVYIYRLNFQRPVWRFVALVL